MNTFTLPAALLLLAATALPALASPVYSCTDRNGNTFYTQDPKSANCNQENIGKLSGYSSVSAPPTASLPRLAEPVSAAAPNPQNPDAVSAAQQQLNAARQALEQGKQVRYGNERNYAKYLERIQGLENQVKAAEQELKRARTGN